MNQIVERAVTQANRHLLERCQQRGVSKVELKILLAAADHLVPVGSGCVAAMLSRNDIVALQAEGIPNAMLERAVRRAVVLDASGVPITVLIPYGRRGQRYRRGAADRRRARN